MADPGETEAPGQPRSLPKPQPSRPGPQTLRAESKAVCFTGLWWCAPRRPDGLTEPAHSGQLPSHGHLSHLPSAPMRLQLGVRSSRGGLREDSLPLGALSSWEGRLTRCTHMHTHTRNEERVPRRPPRPGTGGGCTSHVPPFSHSASTYGSSTVPEPVPGRRGSSEETERLPSIDTKSLCGECTIS